MSSTRAVLIDLYDTLAWTEWVRVRASWQERVGVSEAELLRAFVRTRPARSVGTYGSAEGDIAAVLRAAGVEPEPGLVVEIAAETERFLSEGVHLWEDSLPAIRELRARGLRTAVVSNCDHSTRPVVDRLGLVEETDAVVLSCEVGAAKPDPAVYRTTLERLGVHAEESVFVDDQAAYCDGAASVGMSTFLIRRDDAAPDEGVSEPGGHPVIRDLRALPDLVQAGG